MGRPGQDVAVLNWPAEESRRRELAQRGQPRLLLVGETASPPDDSDCLEDWTRPRASESDIEIRVRALAKRGATHGPLRPSLDSYGVLRLGEHWVHLPPVETRLTQLLLDRFGAVVSRSELITAGWPTENPGRNVLDVHMLRLRRRVAPVSLAICTVRARGYLMERCRDSTG